MRRNLPWLISPIDHRNESGLAMLRQPVYAFVRQAGWILDRKGLFQSEAFAFAQIQIGFYMGNMVHHQAAGGIEIVVFNSRNDIAMLCMAAA